MFTAALWLVAGCGPGGSDERPPVPSDSNVSVIGSATTVRPDELPAGTGTAELLAAANEFESFQIAIESGPRPLRDLTVNFEEPLARPGGEAIPAAGVTVHRAVPYEVETRSDREETAGPWFDALIPERDSFYREDRNAFPVDVETGGRAPGLIDVHRAREPGAPAGTPARFGSRPAGSGAA